MTGPDEDPAIAALKSREAERVAAEREQQKREEVDKEAARWQREIDTLMDRVSHPERNVECVDLTTGQPVPPVTEDSVQRAPPGALEMPLFFTRAKSAEITALLDRKQELLGAMRELASQPPAPGQDAGYTKYQSDQYARELGGIMRKLYAALTANPYITEEWLAENEDKWRPVDLKALIHRYQQRGAEAMARVRSFLGK